MDEAKVRELVSRVEDHRLDFKEGLYSANEELAKDIMAIANLLPLGSTGHILLGVRQRTDDTGEIVGVELGADRDSNYQQRIHGKLNRTPRFSFLTLQLPEGDVGVFEITGVGDRPYFPIADAGKLKKNIALKRQGSSTAPATPDEVREWVLEDRPSKEPAAMLDRIPRKEREGLLLVVDKLNRNFHPMGLLVPITATLLEVDASGAVAMFDLAPKDLKLSIPLNAISHAYKDGARWRVVIDGFLSDETLEYMPVSRARRRETA
jgi:Putative DNA-binding domain